MTVFLLTYNEGEVFNKFYPDEFVNEHFKPNNINFVVLDNGNQPLMKEWCERHDFIYYSSEYNIGSAGGYNWIFKLSEMMDLDFAILMQSDVELSNAQPLLLMEKLNKEVGDKTFLCWPQQLFKFWLSDPNMMEPFNHKLHNLGNLVGFTPKALKQYDCYFDENYVVTHFDDLEFVYWLQMSEERMNFLNTTLLLGYDTKQYYLDTTSEIRYGTTHCFVVEGKDFTFKVHHLSIHIDSLEKGIDDSHEKWRAFNEPYFNEVWKNNYTRKEYDPTRWTRFGYPEYPVDHELNRFKEQYPNLILK